MRSQFVAALFLAATPGEAQIDAIEAVTANNACIGALDRWQRSYEFHIKEWRGVVAVPDTSRIHFYYEQAGIGSRRAGRIVNRTPVLDHSQFRIASGWYDTASGKVTIENCSWNCGDDVPPGGSCA